ncbi:MAG: lipopolysaccharide biosynthesis protein [Geobacter sp.]|nr:MAG: lipopolysaccharide biosynthesis protein [Geobacter sp.]
MDSEVKVEELEINLLELMHVIVKRKMLILKMCGLAAVTSVLFSLALPNIYSATAKVLPPQKEASGGLSALIGQAGGLAGLATGGFGGGSDLYIGILKSRSVADAVIQRLDLTRVYQAKNLESARNELENAVTVQAGKDGIISIVATDKEPKRSALLANTFVDELSRTTVRLNLSKAGTERVFLEKRLALVERDLKAAEEDLKSFTQRNKIVQVDSQAKASIESIARLKAELASKEVQLAVLRSQLTEQSPEVKAVQTAIRRLKEDLTAFAGNSSDGLGIPSLGNVPSVGLEYSRKLRELKTQEAIFEQLTKQYELAKLNEAKDSSALQVLDQAVVPVKKSKPSRALIVILATVSAFFVSLIVVFLQDYIARLSDEDKAIIESMKKHALKFK